ncbi:hypothetical protein NL676_026328 [Syzygium grande]|nr:hypothetical protein NL676_026328 [Syzygium grande]
MVLSGPPTPANGSQSISPSLLRSNSELLGGEAAALPSQSTFSSLVSPRSQLSNVNMLNASSLLNQSFANGGSNPMIPSSGSGQRVGIDMKAELDHLANVGNGMNFGLSNMTNTGTSSQYQGQFSNPSGSQLMPDQAQSQQLEQQNFQQCQQPMQQFSSPQHAQQHQQHQLQQYRAVRGGLASVGPVKLEPQTGGEQHGQQLQQPHLQSLRNLAPVKLEPQQIQSMRNLASVKMEPQHSDQSLFLHQQQQQQQNQQQHQHPQQHQQQAQQQLLHMSRQNSPAAAAQINLLEQQRFLQMRQQQHQQQLLKGMPQQRAQVAQQFQQSIPMRSPVKSVYEPGTCAKRLTDYMYRQQRRPEDNHIDFWRKFVAEYFAPNAKKKWCVSMYGSGRQTTGVFPQDTWHCDICNRKPGRGFEATFEVLPRLFKIKYESGTLEELLYVDMPCEYPIASGQIVLDYAKAIQESVFEQLRVVREGQLRVVFSSDLKICSWEFCARHHEELIPRRLLIPQVSQLAAAAQKYQAATQNASSGLSVPELQNNCNMFLSSARQLAKALEVPLVNDLGYTKRYVRCLQISEVVNCMKDLIDYSRQTRTGPMESLAKYPRRSSASTGVRSQAHQSEEHSQQQAHQQQQTVSQNANNDQNNVQAPSVQLGATDGSRAVNNTASTSATGNAIPGLLHQNSINSRQQSSISNSGSPYGSSGLQIPSPGSSTTLPPAQPNNPSTFQSPTHSSGNNPTHSNGGLSAPNHISTVNSSAKVSPHNGEVEPNDSQSSVQKILQKVMSGQINSGGAIVGVGSLGNDVKHVNGSLPTSSNTGLSTSSNSLLGNGMAHSSNMGGAVYGNMAAGIDSSAMANGVRAVMGNNSFMNGRGVAPMIRDQSMNGNQQDLSNQLLNGLRAGNGFNNLQYDWKPSP